MSKKNKILNAQGIQELRKFLAPKSQAIKDPESLERAKKIKEGWRNSYKIGIAINTFNAHMDNFLQDRGTLTLEGLVHEAGVAMI